MQLKALPVLCIVMVGSGAFAQTKPPEPDYTLAYNVGVVSDYRFRGLTQSRFDPALQGGIDFSHKSGFYPTELHGALTVGRGSAVVGLKFSI